MRLETNKEELDAAMTSREEFSDIYEQGGPRAVLEEIQRLEDSGPVPPGVLVQKARFILLSDEDCNYSPDDAESALKQALKLDGEYIEALQELGYLYYAVMDRTSDAVPLFRKALELSRAAFVESAIGLANCLGEAGPAQEALDLLENARPHAVEEDELERVNGAKEEIHSQAFMRMWE